MISSKLIRKPNRLESQITQKAVVMTEKPSPSKREYPAVYEKAVPIAIGVLIVIVIAMLLYTVLVAIGVLSFG